MGIHEAGCWAPSHFTPNLLNTLLQAFFVFPVLLSIMDQPLVIRSHPNAVIHERQDGVWFQSDSPVVFQHPDMSTMSELVAVFLYHLGDEFTAIRKVGYRFLRRQPHGRFVNLLVWLFNDEHVRVTFGCHRRLMPQYVMDFLVEVGVSTYGPPVAATPVRTVEPSLPSETEMALDNSESDSDYSESTGSSSSDGVEGADCIPETTVGAGSSRYILPALPPIPRLDDVPSFFQQLNLNEGPCEDPLRESMCNDYNTDDGAELQVGHRMRNRAAV
ncbi:hypothetical protein PIB30_005233 [Stylosanthes scabra]|uniref:Uncharacterized protein n=1 Tax=Stylosanthes scabra TaxID=79078 RepID=A0ABU6T4K8_9FABA|nr:hypothetical protein [Stylosanthes scabra]